MILQLDEGHRIVGGERVWELQRLSVKTGKPDWRAYAYFPTFSQALHHAAMAEIRTAPVEGLRDALQTVERVVARCSTLIDGALAQLAASAEQVDARLAGDRSGGAGHAAELQLDDASEAA